MEIANQIVGYIILLIILYWLYLVFFTNKEL